MAASISAGGCDDALLAAAVESMRVGVVLLDHNARVARYNLRAAVMLGTSFLQAPMETWATYWAIPQENGSAAPLAEFPAQRALRGEVCEGVELIGQGGPLAGVHFVVTASPLNAGMQGGAVVTFSRIAPPDPDMIGEVPPIDAAAVLAMTERFDPTRTRAGVLLVEVDDDARRRDAATLRDAGFTVAEAADGHEALHSVVSTPIPVDVVLTDLTLEDETGPELANRLLQIQPGLSILYMSDQPWGAILPAKASSGGRGHLRKPFSPDELVDAVSHASAQAAPDDAPAMAAQRLGHVLLVDDEAPLRRAMAALLRDERFDVIEASDGRAAMAAMQASDVDVVVSDINMPGMTGVDVLKQMRALDVDVPVVLMTAAPRIESASRAVEYDAFRYLTKPVDASELVDVVRLAIRNGRFARLQREA